MNVTRELVFSKLFTLVSAATVGGIPAFVTKSRKYRYWADVPAGMQPALYQQETNQRAQQSRNYGLTLWTLESFLWVYNQHDPNDDVVPSTFINNLIDAIETILLPDPSGKQTLGGIVEHCYIDGDIIIDEGMTPSDIQSVTRIPVKIITGV